MKTATEPEPNERLERRIQARMGKILFWGMLACSALALAGGIIVLAASGGARAGFSHFSLQPGLPTTIGAMFRGLLRGNGSAVILCGVLLLVVVQYVRVFLSGLMFARLKDWFFVAVSFAILAVLVYSLVV